MLLFKLVPFFLHYLALLLRGMNYFICGSGGVRFRFISNLFMDNKQWKKQYFYCNLAVLAQFPLDDFFFNMSVWISVSLSLWLIHWWFVCLFFPLFLVCLFVWWPDFTLSCLFICLFNCFAVRLFDSLADDLSFAPVWLFANWHVFQLLFDHQEMLSVFVFSPSIS